MRLKPGWYLLFAALLYAFVVTLAWQGTRRALSEEKQKLYATLAASALGPPGYTLPLPGACLPKDPSLLPGAPRPYRNGVNYGFVFTGEEVCVPVVYGMGVVAASGGTVIKAEHDYRELTPAAFEALLAAVRDGANPEQMDKLRGREVWIRHSDGRITVYGHLASIAPTVREGAQVYKGQWIGYVGNSGTSFAVKGSKAGARLLFELWEGEVDRGRYFGAGMRPEEVLAAAERLFEVP